MKQEKTSWVITFNRIFSEPIIAAMAGFGIFWLYRINHWNVWFSIIVSLYAAALTSRILQKDFYNK